jgi:hypothetical protein
MATTYTAYATIQEAEDYFNCKLFESAWSMSNPVQREPALIEATRIIDSLNFKGMKHTVWELLEADSDATCEEIRAANAAQELEFPRGADTEIPERIQWACFEIAYALLDGVDPQYELENMSMNDHGIGSVRASYNRNQEPLEHFMNGVPSSTAWKYLRPFLRDDKQRRLIRVS